jgi:hypothetical protein
LLYTIGTTNRHITAFTRIRNFPISNS